MGSPSTGPTIPAPKNPGLRLRWRQTARVGLVLLTGVFAGTVQAKTTDLTVRDHGASGGREEPESWRRALEYYYAGPGWGRDPRPIIHVYRNGQRTRIHKAKYSDGVLAYVRGLGASGQTAGG